MDLLTLVARLTLDKSGYEKGLSDAESQASSTGGKLGKVLGSVGKAAGTVAKVTAAGVAAGATAIGFLTKQSVGAYASYEQLSGGVKKLFGNAADDVMAFANQAYKTAGMSANQYMEQATGFAASLINSLGGDTKEAAKLADIAMQSMSDNVNTFGTDMQAVQFAFQGFSKQNYTMLDNLKLGYGGTKTEMQRLIADAAAATDAQEKLGLSVDGTSMSFDNIVKAIQVVQYEQGIAGTTAKEAATTIEGAFNMTKAAWENLVAGFANPDADLGKLIDELVISVVGDGNGTGLLAQLIPAVERALDGVGKFISQAAPIISAYLPGLMQKILPPLISAATSLVAGLVKSLPLIIQTLIQQAPMIISKMTQAFREAAPLLVELGKNLMQSVINGLSEAFPQVRPVLSAFGKIFETSFKAIGNVVEFFKKNFETIKTVVVAVGGAIAAVGLVGVIGGIAGAIGTVVGAIGGLISALSMIKSFAGLVSVITTLAGGPLVLIPALIGAIAAAVIYLWNTSETFRNFVLGLWTKIQEIVAGAVQVFTNLGAALASIWQDIVNTISTAWNAIVTAVQVAIETVKSVINAGFKLIQKVVYSIMTAIFGKIKFIWTSIKTTVLNAVNAIRTTVQNVFNAVRTTVSSVMSNVQTAISTAWNAAKTTVSNVVEGIKTKIEKGFGAAYTTVTGIFGDIKSKIEEKMNDAKEAVSTAIKKIKEKFNFHWKLPDLKLPHIRITGSWSLKPPFSFPHFSVDWYRKAMDDAFVLDGATIFGSANGRLLGGGEAGREIIIGEEKALDMISKASGNRELLERMNYLIRLLECYLPKRTGPNGRELDRMLGALL